MPEPTQKQALDNATEAMIRETIDALPQLVLDELQEKEQLAVQQSAAESSAEERDSTVGSFDGQAHRRFGADSGNAGEGNDDQRNRFSGARYNYDDSDHDKKKRLVFVTVGILMCILFFFWTWQMRGQLVALQDTSLFSDDFLNLTNDSVDELLKEINAAGEIIESSSAEVFETIVSSSEENLPEVSSTAEYTSSSEAMVLEVLNELVDSSTSTNK